MSYGLYENELLRECQTYPPNLHKIQTLITNGANVNASDNDDILLGEIIMGYGWRARPKCDDCEKEDEACDTCPENADNHYGGFYLPVLIKLFLDNGFDASVRDGAYGGICLRSLSWSSYDKYILEAAKLLLDAGADPEYKMEEDVESVLSRMAVKESAARCLDEDHEEENLFAAMVEILDAKIKGKDYHNIYYYDAILGKRIDAIYVCPDAGTQTEGIFDKTYLNGNSYQNCYDGTMVFECEGVPLCVSSCVTLMINPNMVSDDPEKKMDVSAFFPNCIGARIQNITFDHKNIVHGTTWYGQTIIHLQLDSGVQITYTDNFGEVGKEIMLARFELLYKE